MNMILANLLVGCIILLGYLITKRRQLQTSQPTEERPTAQLYAQYRHNHVEERPD